MIVFFTVILALVCVILMAVVLMQASKGGGLAGLAGAGSSMTTMFGARRTSDFLQRFTIILATIFLLGSLLLNIYISSGSGIDESVIQKNAGQNQTPPQQTIPPTQTAPPPDQQQPGQENPDQNNTENPGQ